MSRKIKKMDTNFLQIIVKTAHQEEAEALILFLTKQRLVASAQVQGPETARQTAEGSVDNSQKWRCKFKTSKVLHPQVKAELGKFFKDNLPEITILPIVKGSKDFLVWLDGQLKQP